MHDIVKNIVGVVLACNNYEVIDLGVMVPCEKILEEAQKHKADVIGLSGLITPSLDEMVHVASEMERLGFQVPLLIGGATTSPAHTAVKIAQTYSHPVIHVLDASRVVNVVGSLVSIEQKTEYVKKVRTEQERLRTVHFSRKSDRTFLSLEKARANQLPTDWSSYNPPKPKFTGIKVYEDISIETLSKYIDWSPFFHAWELHGRYPSILKDDVVGIQATELFKDAKKLLQEVIQKKIFIGKAVVGFFPANSDGDDIKVYTDDSRSTVLHTFHTLRQQSDKGEGEFNYALSDFIAPVSMGQDYLGAFAVTTGHGVEEFAKEFEKKNDDYNSILAKALADRLAEACAEYMHKVMRDDWGYGTSENLTNDELIEEKYRGIRPAPGYPACPDHTEKNTLFQMLDAENKVGITLTENFAMYPASSVSGLYFSHEKSRYFAVGKIAKDQIVEYAQRKKMEVKVAEKWLSPYLGY